MKYPAFLLPVILFLFFISCNDDKKEENKVVIERYLNVRKVDCESMVDSCDKRPGLKFSGLYENSYGPNKAEPTVYSYVICCSNIPAFIDTLKAAHDSLKAYHQNKPDSASHTWILPGGIKVKVKYYRKFLDTDDYDFFWFGDPDTAPSVFYIYNDEYEYLMNSINNRFRTCCLQ